MHNTMHKLSLYRFRLFCFAVIIGLFAPIAGAAPKLAPFQATIGFAEQVQFSTDPSSPCFLIGTISGQGEARTLGTLALASTDCIVPLTATLFLFSSQQVVLTDKHGHEIWATYGGTLSSETGVITGLYFINGGTGRFSHATGAGTIRGVESLDLTTGTGMGEIQLNGTLSY